MIAAAAGDRRWLCEWARAEGCDASAVASFAQARTAASARRFGAMIVALESDARGELELVRALAREQPQTAFVVALSKLDDADVLADLQCMELGLMSKPWMPHVLARVVARALDRLQRAGDAGRAHARDCLEARIDTDHGTVSVGPQRVRLTPRLLKLAAYLLAERGRPIPSAELARNVLERCDASSAEAVRGAIRELRRSLKEVPLRIETVRGYGYQIKAAAACAPRGWDPTRRG